MSAKLHFELLAQYNLWINTALYHAVATLSPEERNKSRDAFCGSILGTLNHQTHHRGQVTALLSQASVDYGVTDLVVLVPD